MAAELYLLSTSTPAHTTAPETSANRENLNSLDFLCLAPPLFAEVSLFDGASDVFAEVYSTEEA